MKVLGLWRRPSIYLALMSAIAYWDRTALHGAFVYDDAGSINKNVVVNGSVPWREVFTRDFWGTPMANVQSHKSFRPLTTLSFKLNWKLSERLRTLGTEQHTFGFNVVNIVLHSVVTALVTEAGAYIFCGNSQTDLVAQVVTGALFGLHPVHTEAVSNMTSRGELLMSFFFLTAFLCFARQVSTPPIRGFASLLGIYVLPWLCMSLSLFCKEQGATTLISLVIYDFVHNHGCLRDYLQCLWRREMAAVAFFRRIVILAIQTLLVCAWRYHLNGETSPDFIYNQNPAGFSTDRFTRIFSVHWVYCLYLRDALDPRFLTPDWSGQSIDLIESKDDPRVFGVLMLWAFSAYCLASLCVGLSEHISLAHRQIRRVVLMAFLSFMFAPFLLSSNILVVVGLMKGDRVIYLPLMGFCVLEALILKVVFLEEGSANGKAPNSRIFPPSLVPTGAKVGYILVLVQLYLFCGKLHERNLAWSHPLNLWVAAYRINPRSYHTMYNCGYELAQKQRYAEAEPVMRPIADPHVDGPSNTFVYAMILYNLNRCDVQIPLIEGALDVVEQRKVNGGVRDDDQSLARVESNLKVAKAFCAETLAKKGALFYDAVQTDPTNEYAIQQATVMAKEVERLKQIRGQSLS